MFKATKAQFGLVAGRAPTTQEMKEVNRILGNFPRNHSLWYSLADGIPAAIYGAIIEVLNDKITSGIAAITVSEPLKAEVSEKTYDRYAELDIDPAPSNVLQFVRKATRPRTNPLTYEQRHLDGRMREKRKMKRERFANA